MAKKNSSQIKDKARESYKNNDLINAEKLYNQILSNDPNCYESLSFLGIINLKKNKLESSKSYLKKALEIKDDDHLLHFHLGFVYQQLENVDQAIISYNNSINLKPTLGAFNNISFIYWNKGERELAVDCLKKCVTTELNLSVLSNLSNFLLILGSNLEALEYSSMAFKISDKFSISPVVTFCKALNRIKKDEYPKENREILNSLELILKIDSEKPTLNDNFVKLIFKDYFNKDIFNQNNLTETTLIDAKLISDLTKNDDSIFECKKFNKLINSEIFLLYLSKNIITSKYLENIFTKIRKFILFNIFEKNETSQDYLKLLCALSIQCEYNGYIWEVSGKERELLDKLINKIISNDNGKALKECLIYSCFFRINEYDEIIKIFKENLDYLGEIKEIVKIQIDQPIKLEEEAKKIPSLKAIEDVTSINVRNQYEEFPYPLWKHNFTKEDFSNIAKVNFSTETLNKIDRLKKYNILIAGCGTGQEPLGMATMYQNSNITAIDLSFKSLAYASLKAKYNDINNITFLQSDILNLDEIEQKFDIITCCGVLHHMQNPSEGLNKLVSLLAEGGVIKLALYSSYARRGLKFIKEYIENNNLTNQIDDIRKLRKGIKNKEVYIDSKYKKDIENSADFYSASELRDLLFHPREINYDLLEVKNLLEENGLKFLEFDNKYLDLKNYYRNLHPEDLTASNLLNWNEIEKNQHLIFSSMYIFWASRK